MTYILNESKIEVKEECKCKEMKPKIVLSSKAEIQINSMIDKLSDNEWIAGLLGEINENYAYIKELFVAEQEVSGGSCEFTNEGAKKLAGQKGVIGWIHSHADMSASQSGTDEHTSGQHDVNVTVNNKREYYATQKVKFDCGDIALVKAEVVGESSIMIDTEFAEKAKELVKEKTYTYNSEKSGSIWNNKTQSFQFSEKFCGVCSNALSTRNNKREWCDGCLRHVHITCMDKKGKMCMDCEKEYGGASYWGRGSYYNSVE